MRLDRPHCWSKTVAPALPIKRETTRTPGRSKLHARHQIQGQQTVGHIGTRGRVETFKAAYPSTRSPPCGQQAPLLVSCSLQQRNKQTNSQTSLHETAVCANLESLQPRQPPSVHGRGCCLPLRPTTAHTHTHTHTVTGLRCLLARPEIYFHIRLGGPAAWTDASCTLALPWNHLKHPIHYTGRHHPTWDPLFRNPNIQTLPTRQPLRLLSIGPISSRPCHGRSLHCTRRPC